MFRTQKAHKHDCCVGLEPDTARPPYSYASDDTRPSFEEPVECALFPVREMKPVISHRRESHPARPLSVADKRSPRSEHIILTR